jgi:hypothetical protein
VLFANSFRTREGMCTPSGKVRLDRCGPSAAGGAAGEIQRPRADARKTHRRRNPMHGQMMARTQTGDVARSSSLVWLEKAAVVGVVAGMLMAMGAMVVAAFAGNGFWAPPRAITGMVFGEEHAGGSFAVGPVVVGMMLHMMLSATFGSVYALAVGLATRALAGGPQLVAGMAWGLVLWLMNTIVIAPHLPGGELMTAAMPAWTWVAGHLLFGGALGLLYAAWRRGATMLTASGAG